MVPPPFHLNLYYSSILFEHLKMEKSSQHMQASSFIALTAASQKHQMLRTSIVNSITEAGLLLLKHKSFYAWIHQMLRSSIVNSITVAQHSKP